MKKIKFKLYEFFDVWQDESYLFWNNVFNLKKWEFKNKEIMNSESFETNITKKTAETLFDVLKKEILSTDKARLEFLKNSGEYIRKFLSNNLKGNIKGIKDWITNSPASAIDYILTNSYIKNLGYNIKFDDKGFWASNEIFKKGNSKKRPCILLKDFTDLDEYCIILPLTSQKNDKNNIYIEVEENKQYIVCSKIQRIHKSYLFELSEENKEKTKNLESWLNQEENKMSVLKKINEIFET